MDLGLIHFNISGGVLIRPFQQNNDPNYNTSRSSLKILEISSTNDGEFCQKYVRRKKQRTEATEVEEYIKSHYKHFDRLPETFKVVALHYSISKFVEYLSSGNEDHSARRKHLYNATRNLKWIHPTLVKDNTLSLRLMDFLADVTCFTSNNIAEALYEKEEMSILQLKRKTRAVANSLYKANLLDRFSAKDFLPNPIPYNSKRKSPYLYRFPDGFYKEEDWKSLIKDIRASFHNFHTIKANETPESRISERVKKQFKREEERIRQELTPESLQLLIAKQGMKAYKKNQQKAMNAFMLKLSNLKEDELRDYVERLLKSMETQISSLFKVVDDTIGLEEKTQISFKTSQQVQLEKRNS